MSALESPFEKWGMPKPGVTAAQIAAWFAAQPDFHDHAPDYVGSAISAQDDWAQGDSRNGAMVGIYQEVEARLRVAANSPFVPGGLPSAEERAKYGPDVP